MAKRAPKTSIQKYELYVTYLSKHQVLKSGKVGPDKEIYQKLWYNLTQQLNCVGSGPARNVESWKKVFSEWKSVVRKKAREGKILSAVENNLLVQTGLVAVEEIPVPEIGANMTEDEPENQIILEEILESLPTENVDIVPVVEEIGTPQTPGISGKGKKRQRETTENVLLKEYKDSQKYHNVRMKEETEQIYHVAKVRIHVERIMQRLRVYRLLDKIPEYLFRHIDDILHTCCVLENLQPPIFSDMPKGENKDNHQ